jgi:hypothetical protein
MHHEFETIGQKRLQHHAELDFGDVSRHLRRDIEGYIPPLEGVWDIRYLRLGYVVCISNEKGQWYPRPTPPAMLWEIVAGTARSLAIHFDRDDIEPELPGFVLRGIPYSRDALRNGPSKHLRRREDAHSNKTHKRQLRDGGEA